MHSTSVSWLGWAKKVMDCRTALFLNSSSGISTLWGYGIVCVLRVCVCAHVCIRVVKSKKGRLYLTIPIEWWLLYEGFNLHWNFQLINWGEPEWAPPSGDAGRTVCRLYRTSRRKSLALLLCVFLRHACVNSKMIHKRWRHGRTLSSIPPRWHCSLYCCLTHSSCVEVTQWGHQRMSIIRPKCFICPMPPRGKLCQIPCVLQSTWCEANELHIHIDRVWRTSWTASLSRTLTHCSH